jgi:hypothetical protein
LTASFLTILFAETESKVLFVMFFGFYPIVKSLIEKINNRIIEWPIKFLIFNLAIVSAYFILTKFLGITFDDLGEFKKYGITVLLVLSNIVFALYDVVISKMAVTYIDRLHTRVSKFL